MAKTAAPVTTGRRARVPSLVDAQRALARYWNYPAFRYHQRRVVVAALQGRDCLAVLPTGGGKSLCFQVPALVLPGLTIVVSPLISLMEDQVGALRARGIGAALLNSTLDAATCRQVMGDVRAGRVSLLYAAPERLPRLVADLRGVPVSRIAVEDFSTPDVVYQIGVAPRRIDLLTSISGVDFDQAWDNRITVELDELAVPVIGREDLLANKRACGRPKDLADAEALIQGDT